MACNNTAVLTRFFVLIEGDGMPSVPLTSVIKLGGLGLGSQGEVTAQEYDKLVKIPDGIVEYPPLSMVIRLGKDPISEVLKKKLFEWWEDFKNVRTYDFKVSITDRNFCPLHTYDYEGCAIKSLNEDDKAIETPSFYHLNLVVQPYKVTSSRFLGLG